MFHKIMGDSIDRINTSTEAGTSSVWDSQIWAMVLSDEIC